MRAAPPSRKRSRVRGVPTADCGRTGAAVTAIDDEGVSLGEERIPTFTVLWAAGVAASPRAAAVADLGWIKLSGLVARLAWLFIHLVFLVGFRNRLSVLLEWTWSYLTFDRGARLILGQPRQPQRARPRQRAAKCPPAEVRPS